MQASQVSALENNLAELCTKVTSLFPLWVVLAAIGALWQPALFTWLPTSCITYGLALTSEGLLRPQPATLCSTSLLGTVCWHWELVVFLQPL